MPSRRRRGRRRHRRRRPRRPGGLRALARGRRRARLRGGRRAAARQHGHGHHDLGERHGRARRRRPAAAGGHARAASATAQHITKYAADGGVELRRTSDATTFRTPATTSTTSPGRRRTRRRRGRAAENGTAAGPSRVRRRPTAASTSPSGRSSVRCGLSWAPTASGRACGARGAGRRRAALLGPAPLERHRRQRGRAARPGEVSFATTGLDGRAILAFDAGGGKTSWYLTLPLEAAPLSARQLRRAPSAASAATWTI